MLQTTNDQVTGQTHSIKVEKLPDGRYKASETVLGEKVIEPYIHENANVAASMVASRCNQHDLKQGEKK